MDVLIELLDPAYRNDTCTIFYNIFILRCNRGQELLKRVRLLFSARLFINFSAINRNVAGICPEHFYRTVADVG